MNLSARIYCVLLSLLVSGMPATADDRPDALPDDATSWPELTPSVGMAYRSTDSIYFVLPSPAPKTLTFPRLANRMRAAQWLGDSQRSSLSLRPEPTDWVLTLTPPDRNRTGIVVLQVAGRPRLADEPRVIQENARGELTLPAHLAVTHGEKLRYEPQPHKSTVGYWTNPDDWVEWHVEVSRPGSYEVELLQGCGSNQGGSHVDVVISPEDGGETHTLPSTRSLKPVTFRISADDRPARSTSTPQGAIDWNSGRDSSHHEPSWMSAKSVCGRTSSALQRHYVGNRTC